MTTETQQEHITIGGSTAGEILGVSPYAGPREAWLKLKGKLEVPDNAAMRGGRAMEPLILDFYETEHPACPLERQVEIVHPEHKFLVGHLDAVAMRPEGDQPDHVVEAKTANWRMRPHWGSPGSDEIPKHYYLQAVFYAGLLGTERCDVPAFLGEWPPAEYVIPFNAELYEFLVAHLAEWYERHIVGDVPPPASAGDDIRAAARALYPEHQRELLSPTPATEARIERLLKLEHKRRNIQHQQEALVGELMDLIEDAEGVETRFGRPITWRSHKRTSTKWSKLVPALKRLALDAGVPAEKLEEVEAEHTNEQTRRPFRWKHLLK